MYRKNKKASPSIENDAFFVSILNKKRPTHKCKSINIVGIDGFEPSTPCL